MVVIKNQDVNEVFKYAQDRTKFILLDHNNRKEVHTSYSFVTNYLITF